MKGYKPADWGSPPSVVETPSGKVFFKAVELKWSKPEVLQKTGAVPKFFRDDPILYAVIRDHGKQKRTDNIGYIGLTAQPKTRSTDHKMIQELAALRGSAKFSFAVVSMREKI